MTIHKEGYSSLAICILFIFVLNAVVQFIIRRHIRLNWVIYICSFILFVIILQFFRSPSIKINTDDNQVLCPADGKVVVIEEAEETEFFKG